MLSPFEQEMEKLRPPEDFFREGLLFVFPVPDKGAPGDPQQAVPVLRLPT